MLKKIGGTIIHRMEQRRTSLVIDILFCVVLMPLIIMLIPVDKWIARYPLFATALCLFLYAVYYTVRMLHVPGMLLRGQYKKFCTYVVVMVILIFILAHFPISEEVKSHLPLKLRMYYRNHIVWLLSLVVIGFSFSIELMFELVKQIATRKDAEAERNKAELSLYQAQINPHFLFNTLNSIYGLVLSKSDQAEKAIVMFADMLKYTYQHTKDEKVPLGEELRYISHYIDLQRLRTSGRTAIRWSHDVEDESVEVAPMILITFVENAFKYGLSARKDSFIDISLSYKRTDGILRFRAANSIVRSQDKALSLVGIENCRSRLRLLYPDNYDLQTGESEGEFKVTLDILL